MFLACALVACQNIVLIQELKCELLENPLAIDNTSPHLSWRMHSSMSGASSTAYQDLLATELDKLNENEADLWNTGKVVETDCISVLYQGKSLTSRSLAYWKVRAWDQNGKASRWSKPALFGVGFLNSDDRDQSASFIGAEHPEVNTQYAPLLRKGFEYERTDGKLLLHVNSLGYHEAISRFRCCACSCCMSVRKTFTDCHI